MRLLAAAAFLLPFVVAGPPQVSRSGRYLVDSTGARFYIKGIAYQLQGTVVTSDDNPFGQPSTFTDPLADGDSCTRDLPFITALGVNVVRVYSVDSTQNHDSCMQTFSDNNIYTIIDLETPTNGSIDSTQPSWPGSIQDEYLRTIDAFSKYDNVLGVNVGNEIIQSTSETAALPFIKAAARDIKAYLASKKLPWLVGYGDVDGGSRSAEIAEYLSCGSADVSIDMYGLNNYEWCGNSSFADSGYQATDTRFADYNVVAYFSEFGCIVGVDGPRPWTEVGTIFSSQMSDHWSGGIAFSYFQDVSPQGDFGLVNISGSTVTTGTDYDNLKAQLTAVSPPTTPTSGTDTYPACTANADLEASTTLPGTPNDSACSCLHEALSCQYTNPTSNYTTIIGDLLNFICSSGIEAVGGTCADVASNGTTGTFGAVSGCDPRIQVSYMMSLYYDLSVAKSSSNSATACDFSGNATLNTANTASATAVASSCIPSPNAVFTPTTPTGDAFSSGSSSGSGSSSSSGSKSSSGSGSGSSGNGAFSVFEDKAPLFSLFSVVVVGVVSGLATLI